MVDEVLYASDFQILAENPKFRKDKRTIQKALDYLKDQAYPQAIGRHVLALDMEDNAKPYALLPDLIETLNRFSDDSHFVQEKLDDYVNTVIKATRNKNLHVHQGELRFTAVEPGFNALLGATHSSRVKLKLLNEDKKSIDIEFTGAHETTIFMLVNELNNDKKVAEATYTTGHPMIDKPKIHVEVTTGKPKTAVERAAKQIARKFKEGKELFEKVSS